MKFVHQELHTTDPTKAKAFYRALFGWTYEDMDMPEGTYTMINTPQGPLGGMMQTENGMPPSWVGYVDVDSVERTVARAVEAGAKVLVPKTEVGGHGYMAWLEDPQGAMFAVWESTAPAQPAEAPASASSSASASASASKKKTAAKKTAPKKTAPKKASPKKAPAKKAPAKKAPPKKATKAAPAKKTGKKAAAKKPAKKAGKTSTTKKAAAKKPGKKTGKKTGKKKTKK